MTRALALFAGVLAVMPAGRLVAQDSVPTRPPAAAPLRPVQFPTYHESRLSNGLTVLVVEHHEQPTVSVSLNFPAGSRTDPAGKEGLADFAAELLTKGTATRTAEEIAATIEGVGGSLSASAGMDFFGVGTSVLTDHLDVAFALLGDVMRHATYPTEELELARTRFQSQLQLTLSQAEGVADRLFARELYGTHPYGRRATPESYRAITRADVQQFALTRLRPSGALLVVAGDVTPARVRALTTKYFPGWAGTPPAIPAAPTPARHATDLLLVHRPGSVQANILVGNTTMLPTDTNYYAARVATQVLGGGADARLFLILREQHGWTYGAYASLTRYRGLGHWEATAETRTEVADSALRELLAQVDRMRAEQVPDSELANVRGFLVGSFPLTIETPGQIANLVATVRLLGLPDSYLRTYRDRLAAMTAPRLQQAATRYYARDSLSIVVVGDATKLLEPLHALGVPMRLVDIDGAALTEDEIAPKAGVPTLDLAQIVSRTDSFVVVVQGNVMGTLVSTTTASSDSLVYRERTEIAAAGMRQETSVHFDPATLTVTQVDQTGATAGQNTAIHLTYAAGRVTGSSTTPQQSGTPRTITIDTTVAPGTYDDNATTLLWPALDLTPGKTIAVNVFSSGDGTAKIMTIKVNAPEPVTVPAGTFDAYRLDIAGGQAPLVVYVSTTTPRRVVKIAIPGAPFTFELAQ